MTVVIPHISQSEIPNPSPPSYFIEYPNILSTMCCCCCECMSDICLVILSVLFPPLPVWIRRGICSSDSLINILLCILGYFPGLIHSWYIIAKYPPYTINHESKVYYVYQNSSDLERGRGGHNGSHNHHHHHHHTHNYNTTVNSEPLNPTSPTYGATNEAQEGSSAAMGAPPAYTELPQK